MKDIKDLDQALIKSLDEFSNEMQNKFNLSKDEHLNEYDLDHISRQVFYMMNDFRKNIIEYLKDNK